ncbi:MAG: hypothetical protein D6813_05995 [Calditrichaeota bacterium]|nr:MAG: hypothetical protein D6813_05995 [Calditrichota bacterium]
MKLVIADDFTGSAELAGIGMRYGFAMELRREIDFKCAADMLVVDVDSRSRSSRDVLQRMNRVVSELKQVSFDLLYKKTDSVLRGHVRIELESLLEGLSRPLVLLVPANPSRGRIISDGIYYIDGKPLHETDLGEVRKKPAKTGRVLDLIGDSTRFQIHVLKPGEDLPDRGIVIGEATCHEDLIQWASRVDKKTIPAGGSEFFLTILEYAGYSKREELIPTEFTFFSNKKMLFVLGSSSEYSRKFLSQIKQLNLPVCLFPGKLTAPETWTSSLLQRWVETVIDAFSRSSRVIAAIGQPIIHERRISRKLAKWMAYLVSKIVKDQVLDEIIIEGGATASAILNCLKWNRFLPLQELAPGVVRLKIVDQNTPYVTVKPGSYAWPACLWETKS